ncbi:MAG: glycosyltransferase family 39 protein [Nitrospirota bacterium]
MRGPGQASKYTLLFFIILLAFLLRLILLAYFWNKPLKIVDETHYQAIAENILEHHEFSLHTGSPTSMRPPLYPAFLSAIYFLTGGKHINAARIAQIILSLGLVLMVYLLGQKVFNEKVGLMAALIIAIYPSFLFFTHFLLTEVLFTFLFSLFIWFFLVFLETQKSRDIWWTGISLGLGALTRSILYPFIAIVLLYLFIATRDTLRRKVTWMILFIAGCLVTIGPWAVRNTLLYKTFVPVDTMGGFNLFMGNYEHTPLNRAWAAVDLTGDKAWYYGHEKTLTGMNEAQKQKWCARMAKEFILSHKLLTLKRDLVKAANFWGLEREIIGGIISGFYPGLDYEALVVILTLLIFSFYVAVMILAIFGLLSNLGQKRRDFIFLLLLLGYFTGIHAIVFGHSRYHLPLIPLLIVLASWSLMNFRLILEKRNRWSFKVAALVSITFISLWVREIIFIDGARYLQHLMGLLF